MKLEYTDNSLLFSNTNIPNVFFTEYFSEASSDAIKVYLYIVFLSRFNKEITINDLSKKLSLSFKTIQESIVYWEEQKILIKKNNGYLLVNLQELELHKLYKPNLSLSAEHLNNTSKNKHRAKAIEEINNHCFGGLMSSSWYADIELWFKKYNFDEEVMIALFQYSYSNSALHRNYIQTVADSWYSQKIRTFSDLDNYYEKHEKINKIKKSIVKKLGLRRNLTQYEEAFVEKWVVDFNYSLKIIEIALKRTTSKSNPNFNYLDKILSDWHDRNLKTEKEIEDFLISFNEKEKNKKEIIKKNSFNSYSQRKYDDWDSLYDNINEE